MDKIITVRIDTGGKGWKGRSVCVCVCVYVCAFRQQILLLSFLFSFDTIKIQSETSSKKKKKKKRGKKIYTTIGIITEKQVFFLFDDIAVPVALLNANTIFVKNQQ